MDAARTFPYGDRSDDFEIAAIDYGDVARSLVRDEYLVRRGGPRWHGNGRGSDQCQRARGTQPH
jgi:hypothetical protein